MKITTDAVQILGGYGCLKSGNLERTMRDAKITQIYEGTNQVQRFVVAEQLITEFLEKYGMGREGKGLIRISISQGRHGRRL